MLWNMVVDTPYLATLSPRVNPRGYEQRVKKMNQKSEYRAFISASGQRIVACGRQRQAMETLIKARALGAGTRKNGVRYNLAEAVRQLANMGVPIGIRTAYYPDIHTTTGKGSATDYFILEDWIAYGAENSTANEANATQRPANLPNATDSFEPFIASGSIKFPRDIDFLNPARKTPLGKVVMAHRARENTVLLGVA